MKIKEKKWNIPYKGFTITISLAPTYPSNHKVGMYHWQILNGKRLITHGNDYYEDIKQSELVSQLKSIINDTKSDIEKLKIESFDKMDEIKKYLKSNKQSDRWEFYRLKEDLDRLLSCIEDMYGE